MGKMLVKLRMAGPHESDYRIPSRMHNDSHGKASNVLNLWGTTYRITNEANTAYFKDQNEIIFDVFLRPKSWDPNIVWVFLSC